MRISPNRAPFPSTVSGLVPEKPAKPSFSVRVENTLKYRSVCQNKREMHPSQSPPKPLESRRFSPLSLAHLDRGNLPEREYEGHFFQRRNFKNDSDLNQRSIRLGRDSNPGQKLRRLLGCPLPYRGTYDSRFRYAVLY
jgi:hypothetical protein